MRPSHLPVLLLALAAGVPDGHGQDTDAPAPIPTAASTAPASSGGGEPAFSGAPERVLAQVNVLGLNRVPEDKVRAILQAAEGRPYPAEALLADQSALLATGEFTTVVFREVPLNETHFRLDIKVEEAPRGAGRPAPTAPAAPPAPTALPGERIVAQIEILGVGPDEVDGLRARLQVREGKPYTAGQKAIDEHTLLGLAQFKSVSIEEVAVGTAAVRVDVRLEKASPRVAPAPDTGLATVGVSTALPASPFLRPRPRTAPAAGALDTPSTPPAPPKPPAAPCEPPWFVGEFKVSGNKHMDERTIKGHLRRRPRDTALYRREELDEDFKKLYRLGTFKHVRSECTPLWDQPAPPEVASTPEEAVSTVAVRITFLVEEHPIVKRVRFEGYGKIGRWKLSDATTLKEKDPLDEVKIAADKDKMLDLYREKGHLGARIGHEVDVDTTAATAELTYKITEGPRTIISEVRLEGVRAFRPRKIMRRMSNRRRKVLQPAKIPEDLDKVRALYQKKGYFHFTVSTWTVDTSTDATSATLRVAIDEGRRERFGQTTFSGHTVYASSALAKGVEYRRGKIFNKEKFDETIASLRDLYADKGYVRALITPVTSYNASTSELDVRFDIEEDRPVYVDFIGVEGNKATKPWVLRREVVLKECPREAALSQCPPFSSSKARKSAEKIRNLGFIDDVDITFQPTAHPQRTDVTFEVVEGKPGMLTAGAGFSSLDGLIGTLSMQHLNLLGRAQRTSVAWQFGARVQDYSLSWLTPWVAGRPTSLGLDLFNTRRIHPFEGSSSAFVNRRLGGSVRAGPRFQDDTYQLNFTYTFQKVGISSIQEEFRNQLSEGTSVQSSLGVEFAIDTRDNFWDPTRGWRHSVGMTFVGGPILRGDVNFWKPYVSDSINFHLASLGDYPLVLSFANRAGYATQFGETPEVPVFDRFFLGGADSLRGYAPSGQVGYPGGGKVYDVFNVELGFPLARERKKTIVKVVTFFDAGSTWDTFRTVQWRIGTGERDIKTDVGFGLRFVTPAFPIRLDYGYGFNHRAGERLYEINFGIGSLF